MRFACRITEATDLTQNMQYLLVFHRNNGCTNVPQCYTYITCFFFLFAVAKIELGRLVLRSVNCTQLCTYTPEGLLIAIDHHVAEAATYTTHNKHKRRLSMPSAGFEPAIPSTKRLHTHA